MKRNDRIPIKVSRKDYIKICNPDHKVLNTEFKKSVCPNCTRKNCVHYVPKK